MTKWFEKILDALFPPRCLFCKTILPGQALWCDVCRDTLPRTSGKICLQCGKKREGCICAKLHPKFTRCVTPLFYNKLAAVGVKRYKLKGLKLYAPYLAEAMAETIREEYSGISFDVVSAVPMHPAKEIERGYNQAKLLALEISCLLGIPYDDGLIYNSGRGTVQRLLGTEERKLNAQIAFDAYAGALAAGKTILLIDDVITTGNTINRCAELLLGLRAKEVYVAAIATTFFDR